MSPYGAATPRAKSEGTLDINNAVCVNSSTRMVPAESQWIVRGQTLVRRMRGIMLMAWLVLITPTLSACDSAPIRDGGSTPNVLSPGQGPDLRDPIDEVTSEDFVFAGEIEGRKPVVHDKFTGPVNLTSIEVSDAGSIAVVINCTPQDEYRIEVADSPSTWGTCAPDGGTAALIPIVVKGAQNGDSIVDVSVDVGDETTYWFIAVPGGA